MKLSNQHEAFRSTFLEDDHIWFLGTLLQELDG